MPSHEFISPIRVSLITSAASTCACICIYEILPLSLARSLPAPFFFQRKCTTGIGATALRKRGEITIRERARIAEEWLYAQKCTRAWSAAPVSIAFAKRILETQTVISSITKRLRKSERLLTALRLLWPTRLVLFAPFPFSASFPSLPLSASLFSLLLREKRMFLSASHRLASFSAPRPASPFS